METHIVHLPDGQFGKMDVSYVLGCKPQYILIAHLIHRASGTLTTVLLYDRSLWADARFPQQFALVREFADNPNARSTFMLYERRVSQRADKDRRACPVFSTITISGSTV